LLTVLLAHRPEYIDSYLDYDFDLILSGHAHGGQWRIPLLINGLYAPNQGWFPKYAGGRYELGNSTFIVSRGLAKESVRVPRIFNPPELVVIDITAFEEQ
jgi:predicted MPP superfamily phosphohydrolase